MCIKCCKCFKELSLFIGSKQGFHQDTKTYIQDLFNINILFSPNKVFLQKNIVTHSYLVCIRTAKDARCKIKMRDIYFILNL